MYQKLFVAGTFDHLHEGHKFLLKKAFETGRAVTIGITSDAFTEQYKKQPSIDSSIQPFPDRKRNLDEWVKTQGFLSTYEIISINDPYEPVVSGNFDALIITSQNKPTGEEINLRRSSQNLPPLILVEVPLLPAFDGKPISATRIRHEEIDTQGNLVLPQGLRAELKKPLGKMIPDVSLWTPPVDGACITVGDVTTDVFLEKGKVPILSIIDLHVQRAPYKAFEDFHFTETVIKIDLQSGPGFISQEALKALEIWKQSYKPTVLVVTGEDDLLVLPAIAAAPLNSFLYYGQPNEGLVEVRVDAHTKEKAKLLLDQFTT